MSLLAFLVVLGAFLFCALLLIDAIAQGKRGRRGPAVVAALLALGVALLAYLLF